MVFWLSLGQAFKEVWLAFTLKPHLWWQLAPVLALWLLLEVYLSRHKREELGWNSALANAITLFWITLAAVQPLFTRPLGEPFPWRAFLLLCLILLYALFLTYASFAHAFRPATIYRLASPVVVHFLSLFAILWGNRVLAVNRYVLLAVLLLWLLVLGLRWLLFWLLPEARHEREREVGRALHEAGAGMARLGERIEKEF